MRRVRKIGPIVVVLLGAILAPCKGLATTYIVTHIGDSGPGSLRQAIMDANNTAGVPDVVLFSIAGGNSITVHSSLTVTDPVWIVGDSVRVIGGAGVNGVFHLAAGSDGSTLTGVALVSSIVGVAVSNSAHHLIYNCRIGTDWNDSPGRGHSSGIVVFSGSDISIGHPVFGVNVISGNASRGILIQGGTRVRVQNNLIGLASDGNTPLPNNTGVEISSSAVAALIGGNRDANAGNIISSNNSYGVYLSNAQTAGNTICGNIIGLNLLQNGARPNQDGITVNTTGGHWIGLGQTGWGNVIAGNSQHGIRITQSANIVMQNNLIGINQAGVAYPNLNGIYVQNGDGLVIGGNGGGLEGNVLSGNSQGGVYLAGSGNTVSGNFFGTHPDGSAAVPNAWGLRVSGSGNLVGGPNLAPNNWRGNIVSGNNGAAIEFEQGLGNTVVGNTVGLNRAGDAVLANSGYGLILNADCRDSLIGGHDPSLRNVISGNNGDAGIWLINGTCGHRIAGNIIGLWADGSEAAGNTNFGLDLYGAAGCMIGGTEPGARNLIAGVVGIRLATQTSTGNTITGNWLGVSADLGSLAGSKNSGISLQLGAHGNALGLPGGQPGNLIANYDYSLELNGATTVRNGIFGNTLCAFVHAGIYLGPGANAGQPVPVITLAYPGSISGTAQAGDTIEVFLAEHRPADQGGSLRYAGSANADGNGFWTLTPAGINPGDYVTALATDGNNNTSAFAANVLVFEPPTPTATSTPPATRTPTPTATPSPVLTATPTMTISPTPAPRTATATQTHTPTSALSRVDLGGSAVLAFPNPAKDRMTFVFHLDAAARVEIHLYNLAGEQVAALSGNFAAGRGLSLVWDLNDVAPGVYVCRMAVNGKEQETFKVAVVK